MSKISGPNERLAIALLAAALTVASSSGAIFNWQTGQIISDTENIIPQSSVVFSDWNTANKNLRYAKLDGLDLKAATFENDWLDYANFSRANLQGAWFSGSTLTSANLTDAIIARARFSGTTVKGFSKEQLYSTASYKSRDLAGVEFRNNNLTGWDLSNQNLTHADFDDSVLADANLSHANFTGANFNATKLSRSNLVGANLTGAYCFFANIASADLSQANLTGACFRGAKLFRANLTDAIINGASFEYNTFQGFTKAQLYSTASYKNKDLSGIQIERDDLIGWDFSGQNLTGAVFHGSKVFKANFTGANLTRVNFGDAWMHDCNVSDAIVVGTHFTHYDFTKEQLYTTASYKNHELPGLEFCWNKLTGWDFSNQNLAHASFEGSSLTDFNFVGANLTEANFSTTTLTNDNFDLADLRKVRGIVLTNAPGVSLRGAILPDGTVGAFALNANEVWRVQPSNLPVILTGPITLSADSAVEITGIVQQKPGTSFTLTVPDKSRLVIRDGGTLTCDKVVLALGSKLDGNGTINAVIVTTEAIPETIHSIQPGLQRSDSSAKPRVQ